MCSLFKMLCFLNGHLRRLYLSYLAKYKECCIFSNTSSLLAPAITGSLLMCGTSVIMMSCGAGGRMMMHCFSSSIPRPANKL